MLSSAITYSSDLGWSIWEINSATGVQARRSSEVLQGYLVMGANGQHVACADDNGLYITDGTRQLLVSDGDSWSMAWSPDCHSLAYCTTEGIYLLGLTETGRLGENIHVMAASASDMAWSPDGRLVAFSVWDRGVFISGPDGNYEQIVSGYAGDLAWSPDGAQIAFSVPSGGIVCADIITGVRRQLTTHVEDGRPVWSPDGEAVAYGRWYPGELRVVKTDGTEDRVISEHRVSDTAWSPDSTRLAYTSHGRYHDGTTLTVVGVDSQRVHLLVGGGSQPVWADNGRIFWLRWRGETIRSIDREGRRTNLRTHRLVGSVRSPDGQHIAYIDHDTPPDTRLMVADCDGREPSVLSVGETSAPMWLPDIRRVAWMSPDGVHTSTLDGKQQERFPVATGWGGCCLIDPLISPDGTRVAYATRDGATITDLNGRSRLLVDAIPYAGVVWSPDGEATAYITRSEALLTDTDGLSTVLSGPDAKGGVTWSPDGTRIAYISDDGIVVVDTSGQDQRIITTEPASGNCLVWSPDSTRLACYSTIREDTPLSLVHLFPIETVTVWPGFVSNVIWSPDSTQVACVCYEQAVIIGVTSGRMRRIIRDETSYDIVWQSHGHE